MPRVRYDGRGRLLAYGHDILSGHVSEMSDADAELLAAHPHIKVTVLTGTVTRPEAGDGEGQHTKPARRKRRTN